MQRNGNALSKLQVESQKFEASIRRAMTGVHAVAFSKIENDRFCGKPMFCLVNGEFAFDCGEGGTNSVRIICGLNRVFQTLYCRLFCGVRSGGVL